MIVHIVNNFILIFLFIVSTIIFYLFYFLFSNYSFIYRALIILLPISPGDLNVRSVVLLLFCVLEL